jgi:hypothetical protein
MMAGISQGYLTVTVHSKPKYFQYFCWDIPMVFVSTHPFLQFKRAPIFSGEMFSALTTCSNELG